jgi:uncharacterized MAPEG superfamily protein
MNAVLAAVPPVIDVGAGMLALFIILFIPHSFKAVALASAASKYRNSNPRGFYGDTCAQLKVDIKKTDDKSKKAALVSQLSFLERAAAAHTNGIEFFVFFGIAVAIARISGVAAPLVASATTLAVVTRAIYTVVYLFGANEFFGLIRSICWAVGVAVACSLFWMASVAEGGLLSKLG